VLLNWEQKFDGDIDNDELINYVIPPPEPPLTPTNTDSGLTHALSNNFGWGLSRCIDILHE